MRYVIYGAGGVGGAIGGRLFQHGHDVTLIARGAHLEALGKHGLALQWPDGETVLPVPAVGSPSDIEWSDEHVVVLAMKTQDTTGALDELAAVAPVDTSLVCAQNGVANERMALRRFRRVYGMCVMLPASHLEPGVAQIHATPLSGILDVGRYPEGVDDVAERVAADLSASTFSSVPSPTVMRLKYAKLLMNLGNSLEAACGSGARGSDLYARARAEGEACLQAAGIDFASAEEDQARRGDFRIAPIAGQRRGGGSSWQSLARGTGSIESDWLNGEIVLLGRLHGVPTPVNELLQRTANCLARDGAAPGSVAIEDLETQLA